MLPVLTKLNNLKHRRSVQQYTIYRMKYICYRRIISANLADFRVILEQGNQSERKFPLVTAGLLY